MTFALSFFKNNFEYYIYLNYLQKPLKFNNDQKSLKNPETFIPHLNLLMYIYLEPI